MPGAQLSQDALPTLEASRREKRKSPSGVSTNSIVFSAHVGTSSEIFPQILELYLPKGSTIADVNCGRGVFWKQVEVVYSA
jgi:hypothetical protein